MARFRGKKEKANKEIRGKAFFIRDSKGKGKKIMVADMGKGEKKSVETKGMS